MGLIYHLFCLVVIGSCTNVSATGILGHGYYLPDQNIDDPDGSGRNIFKTLTSNDCIAEKEKKETTNERSTYASRKKFYNHLSVQSGISFHLIGAFSMGASLNIKTRSKFTREESITGTSIDIVTHVSIAFLKPECYKGRQFHLTDELLHDLDLLPHSLSRPELKSSWNRYDDFLRNYGSHVITEIYKGASIRQWTFSKTEKEYTEQQHNAKSCSQFWNSGSVGLLGANACAEVTVEQLREVEELEMSSYLEVRGGSDDTRNQLRAERSNELITKLLNEGRTDPTAVGYKYTAIWEILKAKYPDHPRYAISRTLQQYYMGYLDFGCTQIKADNMFLRSFRYDPFSTSTAPDFHCILEREGCHSEEDCHNGYCHGPLCVEHIPAPKGKKAGEVKIREEQSDGTSEGINRSCRDGCDLDWSEDLVIWSNTADNPTVPPPPLLRDKGEIRRAGMLVYTMLTFTFLANSIELLIR